MKLLQLFFSLILISTTQQAVCQSNSNVNCSIMKKGKFLYLDADDKTAYIVMDGNYQIEKNGKNSYFIESTIEWINDCTYIMTMTKITIPNFPFGPGDKMKVEITEVKDDIIYYTSTVNEVSWSGRFKKIGD